jgi:hypothetical protein
MKLFNGGFINTKRNGDDEDEGGGCGCGGR